MAVSGHVDDGDAGMLQLYHLTIYYFILYYFIIIMAVSGHVDDGDAGLLQHYLLTTYYIKLLCNYIILLILSPCIVTSRTVTPGCCSMARTLGAKTAGRALYIEYILYYYYNGCVWSRR